MLSVGKALKNKHTWDLKKKFWVYNDMHMAQEIQIGF